MEQVVTHCFCPHWLEKERDCSLSLKVGIWGISLKCPAWSYIFSFFFFLVASTAFSIPTLSSGADRNSASWSTAHLVAKPAFRLHPPLSLDPLLLLMGPSIPTASVSWEFFHKSYLTFLNLFMWSATVLVLSTSHLSLSSFNFVSIGLRHLTGRKLMADERSWRECRFQITLVLFQQVGTLAVLSTKWYLGWFILRSWTDPTTIWRH